MNTINTFKAAVQRASLSALLLVCALAAVAQNRVYIDDFNIIPGETVEVAVKMDNDVPVSSMQFDMVLPEGLSYVDQSIVKNAERITRSSHSISTSVINGSRRFMVAEQATDPTKGAIQGSEGAIFTIKVSAAESFTGEDAKIVINNVVTTDNTNLTTGPVEHKFDATSAAVMVNAGTFTLDVESLSLINEEPQFITVLLANNLTVVGMQADIIMPEGMELATDEQGEFFGYTDRLSSNTIISAAPLKEGHGYRMMISSLTNDRFVGNEGALFSFGVKATADLPEDAVIGLANIKLSSPSGIVYGATCEQTVAVKRMVIPVEEYNALTEKVTMLASTLTDMQAAIAEDYPLLANDEELAATAAQLSADIATLSGDIQKAYDNGSLADELEALSTREANLEQALMDYQATAAQKNAYYVSENASYALVTEQLDLLNSTYTDMVASISEDYPLAAVHADVLVQEETVKDALAQFSADIEAAREAGEMAAQSDALLARAEALGADVVNLQAVAAQKNAFLVSENTSYALVTEQLDLLNSTYTDMVASISEDYPLAAVHADVLVQEETVKDALAQFSADIEAAREAGEMAAQSDALLARAEALGADVVNLQAVAAQKNAFLVSENTLYKELTGSVKSLEKALIQANAVIAAKYPAGSEAPEVVAAAETLDADIEALSDDIEEAYDAEALAEGEEKYLAKIDELTLAIASLKELAAEKDHEITSVGTAKSDLQAPVAIYTLGGVKVSRVEKGGTYILEYADGSRIKRQIK